MILVSDPFTITVPPVTGIDVSSFQSTDLTSVVQATGAKHVVVQLYGYGERPSPGISEAQIESALNLGCTVGGYRFGYSTLDATLSVNSAIDDADLMGIVLPCLWLDCEDSTGDNGPDAAWLRAAGAACYARKVQPAIYTRKEWWEDFMANTSEFAHWPLGVAQYDGNPDLGSTILFGGWQQASWKQYTTDPVDTGTFASNIV